MRFSFGASLMALATSVAAFDPSGSNNVVLYWGQASAGSQEPLGTYCESNAADVYVVSFLNSFNGNGDLTLTISGCNDNFAGGLAKCPAIAADIKKCQGLGKKVFISLGGAVGSYGFTSDAGGANFADTLWNTFGGGNAAERPFGDAIVDGYDLDIENQQQMGYVALVKRLREHFSSSSGQYYISATPQCPFPDASVGEALAGADIDFAYVQFYNNYCGVNNPGQFNFDTWDNFAKTVSPNKNIKIYLGVPAAQSAASTGYIDGATLKSFVDKVKQYSSFGGIMMWDASQAFINKENGVTYAEIAKNALGGGSPAPAVSVASTPVASVASTPVASVASTPVASSAAPWAPSSSSAPVWAPSSAPAPAPGAPESSPVSSSAPWAPASSHTPDNGMWKPENGVSSVSSLAAPSNPVFAAESGAVGDSTVTEEHTVTSVGETVTSTVPRDVPAASSAAEAAAETHSIPESAPAAESSTSSKAKHTVYATTWKSVYVDTTVVNVPGPSPTGAPSEGVADAPASDAASPESTPGVSTVASLAAPSGPAFAAESGEVKNKPENGTEAVQADNSTQSSAELTTTTTSSVFTTRTVTGTTVSVSGVASSADAADAVETSSAVESSAAASSAPVSSAESSAPASTPVQTSEGAAAAPESAPVTSSSSPASSAGEAAAEVTHAPSSTLSTVAPSDLLSQATTASSAATISLADSAPQKTISPESAHPPCDGKQGNELAKCLNGIYGNQEVISKLSVQDKQKPVATGAPADKPASSAAPSAAPTSADKPEATPASDSKPADKPADASKPAESSNSDKPASDNSDKPESNSDNKPASESSDKPADSSSTPSTSKPLADSGCTEGEVGCSPQGEFIMCNFNKWVHFACPPTTTCFATAQGKNAVVGCNFIDAPIPLLKRDESRRPPPTLQQRRQNKVDVFALLQ
ncbi:Endochitinase [Yarrowia sp. B02]|nr:Endochitinase [Yarrowia sp. B02]